MIATTSSLVLALTLATPTQAQTVGGVPESPPLPPHPVPSGIGEHSVELTWPRGDDATILHPTDWFEVQQRRFGAQHDGVGLGEDADWSVVGSGGDRVGLPAAARREGQHEAQVISVRADHGQVINSGFFQLSFSYGGRGTAYVNPKERYTDAAHANNHTSVITAPIPWDASAAQVQEALESLETVQRVQVRRCDASGGLGGSGGWLGGCPYGKRGGFSWEVLFEPVFYVDEHNTATGNYLPDHTGHKFVDEAPLSTRRSTNLGGSPPVYEQGAAVEEVDVSTRTVRLSLLPADLHQGHTLFVHRAPTTSTQPRPPTSARESTATNSGEHASGETASQQEVIALKVVQIKQPSSVVVAELPNGEALVGGWATVTAASGREALWSMQRGSVYATLTKGDVPNLVVHKETLSQKHRWSGPGGMVSVSKGGRHGFLHASVCAPTHFSFPAGGSQGGSVSPSRQPQQSNNAVSSNEYASAHVARVHQSKLWGTCHFKATGLDPGHRYEFRLRAHNAAGFSAWSPTSSLVATLVVLPPPQPPAPLFAGASLLPSLPRSSPSASRHDNDDADAAAAITVYVSGAGSFRGPNGRASNSAVGDSGAGRISSVAPNGQEEGSLERFVVQYEDMAAPGVWAHGAETLLAHHTPEATTHALPPQSVTVRGLSPGHTYRFRTKATRSTSSSSSSLSSSWSPPSLPMATPPRRPPPPPPPLVEGLHIDAVDLAWAPDPRSSGVLGYELEYRRVPNGYFEPLPSYQGGSSLSSGAGAGGGSAEKNNNNDDYNNVVVAEARASVQLITVHADRTAQVTDGFFWLVLPMAGPSDSRHNATTAGASPTFSHASPTNIGDPMRRSVTEALPFDASSEVVRAAIQSLFGPSAASVTVDRVGPTRREHAKQSSTGALSPMSSSFAVASNREPLGKGAFRWRVEMRPPSKHASDWVPPPRLTVLKDTLAECVVNDVLNLCANSTSNNASSSDSSCQDVASPTHKGDAMATVNQPHKYAARKQLRVEQGKTCFKIWSGAGPTVAVETLQAGAAATLGDSLHLSTRVRGLEPHKLYAFRMKVRTTNGHSDWSNPTPTVRTLHRLGEGGVVALSTTPPLPNADALLSNVRKDMVFLESGTGRFPANARDPDFAHGIGRGGVAGSSGQSGLAVLQVLAPRSGSGASSSSKATFFEAPDAPSFQQLFTVPSVPSTNPSQANQPFYVVAKLWGAGGGGGGLGVGQSQTHPQSGINTGPAIGRAAMNASQASQLALGGGGAFVSVKVSVAPGDQLMVQVGNGGEPPSGENPGRGGTGGGGARGGGGGDWGGGGGGGATSLWRRLPRSSGYEPLAIAGGGGGAGSTDYCCAHGGSGGAYVHLRQNDGSSPPNDVGFPQDESEAPGRHGTPVYNGPAQFANRKEFTPPDCAPGDKRCESSFDLSGMPARHNHLDWGANSGLADYSQLALGGGGGNGQFERGGAAGASGSFEVSLEGVTEANNQPRGSAGVPHVSGNARGGRQPVNGTKMHGGEGGDGKEAGGGGGGGYYGGGGGGGGVDGSGGGGGSSWANLTAIFHDYSGSGATTSNNAMWTEPAAPLKPVVAFANASLVTVAWGAVTVFDHGQRFGYEATSYDVEVSYGPRNDSFSRLVVVSGAAPRLASVAHLPPETTLCFRVRAVSRTSFSAFSEPVEASTLAAPINQWARIWPRRSVGAFAGYGIAAPVAGRPHLSTGTQDPPTRSYEPIGPRDDATRFADPPSSSVAVAPSARRGHSLAVLYGFIYLFGGLTTHGYECSAAVTDTLRFGAASAGLAADPCRYLPGESDELWRYDPTTNLWSLILPGQGRWLQDGNDQKPPPREQHTASILGGKMLIFGGVASSADNISPHQESTSTQQTMNGEGSRLQPSFKNDLWELDVGLLSYHFTAHADGNVHNRTNTTYTNSHSSSEEEDDADRSSPYYYEQEAARRRRRSSGAGWEIPEGGVTFVSIEVNETELLLSHKNNNHSGSTTSFKDASSSIPFFEARIPTDLCIVSVEVEVHLRHPCTRQLELVLFGPGPNSGDLNHEPSSHSHATMLFDHHDGTANSGCGRHLAHTVFSDDATLPASTSEFVSPFTGKFQPVEPLSTYAGLRPSGEWVLGVYDHDVDGLKGKLEDVSLRFTTQECDQTFHWTPLLGHHQNDTDSSSTSSGSANSEKQWPAPRAQHAVVVVDHSLFVFGGRGPGKEMSSSNSYAAMSTRMLHDLWRFDRIDQSWHLLADFGSSGGGQSQFGSRFLGSSQMSGRVALLSPWGLMALGGLREGQMGMHPNMKQQGYGNDDTKTVWQHDLWSEEWAPIATEDEISSSSHDYSLHASVPTGKYLSAACLVGEGFNEGQGSSSTSAHGPVVNPAGYSAPSPHWPAVYTFGGDDSARTSSDDLRRLSLHGLAAQPFLTKKNALHHHAGIESAATAVPPAELQRSRCDWMLKAGSTSDRRWKASCLRNTTSQGPTTPPTSCSLLNVLQRAWCLGDYQSLGYL